ncbi:uncharacterized protein LOC107013373 [Solanum pennellii]|uniref:Uncharacterized protein LOC107013373 n=1 Tax=Solanum pennellii TaxID=28526 RepID=A0ABM1GBQ1_SOLPN|nr:uncharacterized protein LOC107013373 [Solanum pennellii]
MDLSRLMVHVQKVEYSRKKKGIRDSRSPKAHDKRSTTPRGGRPKPKKGNGGDMQHPRKNFAKCGRAHNGECRKGTNACFNCGKSGNMVKDCPQNRGQAGGNAHPRPSPQGAAAAETPKRKRFYALKGRE